jgi:hypothetical protein
VIHRAEGVWDPVLAAVAHDHDVDVTERLAAVSALAGSIDQTARLLDLTGIPVSPLDRPGHHVLKAAECGPA